MGDSSRKSPRCKDRAAAQLPIRLRPPSAAPPPHGFSLVEVIVVLTVLSILVSIAAPSFRRSVEQARADVAAANLRAVWSAQRLYWLENRTYTANFSELESLGLIDPTIASATTIYVYAIASADSDSFSATATRTGSTLWSGQLSIDQTGVGSGVIQALGHPDIVPGFQ